MGKIDYTNTVKGKLFSLAQGRGSISGAFTPEQFIPPGPDLRPYPWPPKPPVPIDLGLDKRAELISNTKIDNCITWSFVAVAGNTVMLTCVSPLTGKTHVLTRDVAFTVFSTVIAQNFPLPVNSEDVDARNKFTLEYIDQSPLFFYLKTTEGKYLATTPENIKIFDQTIGLLSIFTEEQKSDPAVNDNCVWFLDSEMQKAMQKARDFDAVSKVIKKNVDQSYINHIMFV